jgi:serine/threonine-protein kinase
LDGSYAFEIPGYCPERLIGEGGFGQVWRARREAIRGAQGGQDTQVAEGGQGGHSDDGAIVAIKILHLELVRSVDALTRFQRELDAIERLQHPNVVRGRGHGTLDDGRPYLILEYVEGPSLREVLHERGALPPAEMLSILEPLCDALNAAHDAGLVHRDVKASNVILARGSGGGVRPVLLDFGLVKLVDQVGPGLTSSRSMLGTPAAMAPEQMRGQPVDPRTDIYALGLLAFHMLTGQPAFGGAPGVVQSYLQVHGPRPRPSSKVDIDPAIDVPIARALAPEPDARFSNARSFSEALRAVIHGAVGAELEVAVLYVEGDAADVLTAIEGARSAGLTLALTAPDSMLAVVPRNQIDSPAWTALRDQVSGFSGHTHVAIGLSRATISGQLVDGPALDVEGWAPYPLPSGLWVADGL